MAIGAAIGVWVLALLLPATGSAFDAYTLETDLVFEVSLPGEGSVVKGTFHAVSDPEFASWDLSTSGQDAGAPPGTHACADLGFNPFASCPFFYELVGDQAEAVAFRLSLDADSGPVSRVGPSFSSFVDDASGGSAYVISAAPAERVPVSSAGGVLDFLDPAAALDPAFYLQPGQSTVWLLSRYEVGAVAAALAGGATVRMSLRQGPVFATTGTFGLVKLSEPGFPLAPAVALLLPAAAAAVRRPARRPGPRSGTRR